MNSSLSTIVPCDVPALPMPRRDAASPLWFGVCLAVVLVGAKAVLLNASSSGRWLAQLAIVSFRDVLYALAVGVAGEVAVRAAMLSRRTGFARAVWGTFLGFCVISTIYCVVAAGVFDYFGLPLSYDLLRLVGNIRTMRASITERITLPLAASLVVVPAIFLAGALAACRRRRVAQVGLGTACVWASIGIWQNAAHPDDLSNRGLAPNPHFELVRSTFVGMTGMRRPTFPDFPPDDTVEFRSFQARGAPQGRFEPPDGVARPRNVIFIVLESVGVKYLSLYGSRYETTPCLSSESASALVFDNFYAQAPYTYYSFRTINFSIYPGLPWCYAPWAGRPLPPPLAQPLRDRGWRTVYMNNSDLDWSDQRCLLDECASFDSLLDFRDLGCPPLTGPGVEDRCLIDRLIRWIDDEPNRPFLAVCWTDQTHDPYATSPGVPLVDFFQGTPLPRHADDLSRYLNVIRETDRHLGRLFDALRLRGLADDTLVVITGDHGEAFGDPHDQRGHCLKIFEENVRVPLVLWNPRLFAPGRRVADVASHVDVNPTIADVLGVTPPGGWQGHSLFDPSRPARAFIMNNVGEYVFGVREGKWKYILDATGSRETLFDLSRDPDEQHNVAGSEPDRCRRWQQRVAAWASFEEKFLRGRAD